MAKEVTKRFKLIIPAGTATPAPPLGPILGQNGINIGEFTKEFNEKTNEQRGLDMPVLVEVMKDRSFKMYIKKPTVASMLKKKAGMQKGSATPNKDRTKKLSREDLREIAETKMSDLNTKDIEAAINIIAGAAASLGIEITN